MKADARFTNLPKHFWANVRTISQQAGYTVRAGRSKGTNLSTKARKAVGLIKVPNLAEIKAALEEINLTAKHLVNEKAKPTDFGEKLIDYFNYRADSLNNLARSQLMNEADAKHVYEDHKSKYRLKDNDVVWNKQKPRTPAYLTNIVNMLIKAHAATMQCDFNPQKLVTITKSRKPFRTFARRLDGAFPSTVNPIAVWECKEYYRSMKNFGSRIADAVYECLMDGMEIQELRETGRDVRHYLFIDGLDTWWLKGKSYLCRIVDTSSARRSCSGFLGWCGNGYR